MNILLFKRDLDQYSNVDIKTMAKMYNLVGDVNDLRWMVAIKNSQSTATMITGYPTFDMDIMERMDDDTLLQYCNTSAEIRKQCDPIWKERAKKIGYDGELAPAKDWQQIYIFLKKYKEFLINTKDFKSIVDLQITELTFKQFNEYSEILDKYIHIINEAIKLGATNVIEWLIDTHNIKDDKHIDNFFNTASAHCQINVLNMLYQRYGSIFSDGNAKTLIKQYLINAIEKGCVGVLKFWKDKNNTKYTQRDAGLAFMHGQRDVLDYFATIRVLPQNSVVSYAIATDSLDRLQWLIDNGVKFSPKDISNLNKKKYGKKVLKYLNNKNRL